MSDMRALESEARGFTRKSSGRDWLMSANGSTSRSKSSPRNAKDSNSKDPATEPTLSDPRQVSEALILRTRAHSAQGLLEATGQSDRIGREASQAYLKGSRLRKTTTLRLK